MPTLSAVLRAELVPTLTADMLSAELCVDTALLAEAVPLRDEAAVLRADSVPAELSMCFSRGRVASSPADRRSALFKGTLGTFRRSVSVRGGRAGFGTLLPEEHGELSCGGPDFTARCVGARRTRFTCSSCAGASVADSSSVHTEGRAASICARVHGWNVDWYVVCPSTVWYVDHVVPTACGSACAGAHAVVAALHSFSEPLRDEAAMSHAELMRTAGSWRSPAERHRPGASRSPMASTTLVMDCGGPRGESKGDDATELRGCGRPALPPREESRGEDAAELRGGKPALAPGCLEMAEASLTACRKLSSVGTIRAPATSLSVYSR